MTSTHCFIKSCLLKKSLMHISVDWIELSVVILWIFEFVNRRKVDSATCISIAALIYFVSLCVSLQWLNVLWRRDIFWQCFPTETKRCESIISFYLCLFSSCLYEIVPMFNLSSIFSLFWKLWFWSYIYLISSWSWSSKLFIT